MNKIKRCLALVLCLCTLCTSGIGELSLALADEATQTFVTETPVAETSEITPTPTVEATILQVDATQTPEVIQTVSPEETAALENSEVPQTEEPSQPSDTAPEIDFLRDASYSEKFTEGYAQLLKSAKVYSEASSDSPALGEIASGEFVACISRSGANWLEVAFVVDGDIAQGWIVANALRPISESEVSDLRTTSASSDGYKLTAPEFTAEQAEPSVASAEGDMPDSEGNESSNDISEVAPVLSPASITLRKGNTDTAQIIVTNADAITEDIGFSSDNTDIATVDENGLVTAVGQGSCVITVSAGSMRAACPVSVYTPADDFTLTASKNSLKVGESIVLSIQYPQYTYGNVSFSANSDIVSVNENGTVTANSKGDCTVTATLGEKTESVSFTVLALPDTIEMTVSATHLAVGETAQAEIQLPEYTYADSVEYTSSESEIATVDENGVITALKAGECTITAKVATAEADVTLTISDLHLGELRMGVGESGQLPNQVGDESVEGATYACANPEIATVSESGSVTAVAAGDTVITITTAKGIHALVAVHVLNIPDRITIPTDTINILIGQTITLPYTISREDGTDCTGKVTLSSADTNRVTVSNSQIYAKSVGETTVTATVGTAKASVKVVVWSYPNRMYFEFTDQTVKAGSTINNRVALFNNSGSFIFTENDGEGVGKFSTENPEIATVNQSGVITGVSAGVTNLVYTAASGMQIRTSVRVIGLPTKITLNNTELTIGVGSTSTLSATFQENEDGAITYSSDAPEIATVSKDGVITAVSKGIANITATAEGGASAVCAVTVVAAPSRAEFPAETINLIVGTTVKLPVEFFNTDNESCEANYTLVSSSTKYAKISNGTSVYAARTGTAYIRAVADNGAEGVVRIKIWDKPKKLYLSTYSMMLGEGMSDTLLAKIYRSSSKNFIYSQADGECVGRFTVDDSTVATVDASGKITGVKKGETTVRFTTVTGLSASCKVTVMAPPSEITLNKTELTLGVNDQSQLSATYGTFEMGTTTYASVNPEIATVTEDGKITAVEKGVATIIATTNSGLTASCIVTVVPAPAQVVFPTSTINIFRYSVIDLPVEFINTDGVNCETTYTLSTSKSKYVAVSGTQIYGARTGTAYITVKTYNGVTGTVRVQVWDKPKRLYFEKTNMQIGEGMTELNRVNVWIKSGKSFIYTEADGASVGSFSTGDTKIATVDSAGNVTGVSKGSTTLTFKTTTGLSITTNVTVLAQPTELHLNYETLNIGVGDSAQYSASYGTFEMGTTTYESSNPEIATITADGKITAVAKGTATITATTNNGIKATSEVKVVPAPAQVVFPAKTINILRYTTAELPVEFINTDGDKCETTYTLSTSKSKYVAVSGTQIYAARTGTAYITVKTYNGVTGTVAVKVWDRPSRLYLEYSTLQLGVGMTAQNRVNVWIKSGKSFIYSAADGKAVGTFSVDDPKIATVDSAGNVTGLTKGETTLRFTATNGLQVSGRISVLSAPSVITVDKESVTLGENMTEKLTASVGAFEMGTITFSSSNTEVATVSQDGTITAKKAGSALITAETVSASGGKLYATSKVTVVPAPDKIEAEYTYMNVAIGGEAQINVSYSYKGTDNCMGTVTYMSSSSSIAKVSSTGVVTGVKAGNCIIRAQLQNGIYVDCQVTVRKAPTKVELSASSVDLGVSQTYKLYGRIYYSGGSFIYSAADTSIAKFESSNTDVLTVSADGTVTALKPGTAYVRLYTYNGKGASSLCKFTVMAGPEWISLTEISTALNVNQSTVLYCDRSADSMTAFTYTSSNPEVVRVTANGSSCTIYGVSAGTATITASSSNGKTAKCDVVVYALPESAAFESSTLVMGVGEIAALPNIEVTSASGECSKKVTYTSSNTTCVTVDKNGRATGLSAGSAIITATTYNGKTATCTVTVIAAPTSIQVFADKERMSVGETANLSAKVDTIGSYTFSVEDSTVLSINGNTVTALSVGKTNVIAKAYNGIVGKYAIEVLPTADSVTLNHSAVTLGIGMSQALTAEIPNNTLATLTYESSNPSVATVSEDGTVQAIAKGSARIYVRVAGVESAYDTCDVRVIPMPESISLSSNEVNLFVGETQKLTAKALNGTDSDCYGSITFTCDNPDVAEISANGTINAIGVGEATITAHSTVNEALTATCLVKVTEANTWFSERNVTLGVGEVYAYTIHHSPEAENLSVSSSNPEVATVNLNGEITAKAIGSTTITAVCGTDEAECVVTVKAAPTGLTLDADAVTLYAGETAQITASVLDADAAGHIRYSTKDSTVATVDANGLITAVGTGETEIIATTYVDNITVSCRVSVVNAPETIRFAEMDELILSKGDTYTLAQPVITSASGLCDMRYTLSIASNSIATLSESNGSYIVSAKSVGTTVLRVKTLNGKADTLTLTVVEVPTAINFDPELSMMGLGETYTPQLLGNNGSVIGAIFASDSTCISVSPDGKTITANAKGKATITAYATHFANLSASIEIEVVDMATEFTLGDAQYRMGIGENFELTTVTEEGTAVAALSYTSDNENVACVDRNGVVYAIGEGEATITANAQNGASATKKIIVSRMATKIRLLPYSIKACLEDTVQLKVLYGSDSEYANVRFDSADDSIATVDENGLVRFHAIGTTTISAEAYNGLSDVITVEVCETPTSISFEQTKALILVGERAALNPTFDKGACCYTLESSDPEIISIGEDGYLEANKKGSATITLKSVINDLSAQIEVEVVDKIGGITVVLEKDTLEMHETTNVLYSFLPTNLLSSGNVKFESSNPDVATVDENGVVTGIAYGEAEIRVIASDGTVGKANINVLGGKRRAFVAYYYGNSTDSGYLRFASNNAYSFTEALKEATVEGRQYEICGPIVNAAKSTLFSRIDDFFRDTTEDDTSVLYFCSHGSTVGGYCFTIPNNNNSENEDEYRVYAAEIYNHISKIKGNVIVVMDSCNAGGLIDTINDKLVEENGRISILASSHVDTPSSFYSVSSVMNSVDYFTFALLYGLGYSASAELAPEKIHGWTSLTAPADENHDGKVTIGEVFSYAKSLTEYMVSNKYGGKGFYGNVKQSPQSYIIEKVKDLVLFKR